MMVKQISVFLENKPGKLKELTDVLRENNINMRALSVADAQDFGIVRLIVDDVYNASTVIKDAGYVSSTKDVIAIELSDQPGSLANVLDIFGENGINVEYMYAFNTHTSGKAHLIFRVTDIKKGAEVLKVSDVRLISQEDLAKL